VKFLASKKKKKKKREREREGGGGMDTGQVDPINGLWLWQGWCVW
jgi:hypothetical protein